MSKLTTKTTSAEQTNAELIEEILNRKLKPIYWAVGIVVAIHIGSSGPLTQEVMAIKADYIPSEEAYRNFVSKGNYHQMQKSEHEVDIQAIRHPEDADFLYIRHNSDEAENLGLIYRSAIPINERK